MQAVVAAGLSLLVVACDGPRSYVGEVCGSADTVAGRARETAFDRPKVVPFRALLFSRHRGYTHQSTPAATAALHVLGTSRGFTVEATEAADRFSDDGLRAFRVVIFLGTTGDVLDEGQQAAFTRYIRAGGGFVGIHSASDTELDWEWYHRLVGAHFASHPPVQRARLRVDDSPHPSTRTLPREWVRTDEWYDFRSSPPPSAQTLVSVDEHSYVGGGMGASHPVSWAQSFEGGRSWYTAMGHTTCSYAEPAFLEHLAGGILWAASENDRAP